jgi:hypothetical protein
MSKFGWSLPPGVATLPGESADEQAAEALVEELYEAVAPLRTFYTEPGIADETEDGVVTALEKIVSDAYTKGRADALADEAIAAEYNAAQNL